MGRPDFLQRGRVSEGTTIVRAKINPGIKIKANVGKGRETILAVCESREVLFEASGGRVCQDRKQRTNQNVLHSKFFEITPLASAS